MLTIKESSVMWAWVCPVTGMVLDEAWGGTEAYAKSKTERAWGKRRTEAGEMRAVRVTITPLTDGEQAAHRAEYSAWLEAKKDRA